MVGSGYPSYATGSEFLVPLSPFTGPDALVQVKEAIFGKGYYFGAVVAPSFKNYYAIDVTLESIGGTEVGVVTKYVTDIFAVADPDLETRISNGRYSVSKTRAYIPKELAERIFKITIAIVKKARYPEHPRMGADGTRFLFSAYTYVGECWSPWDGEPAQLVLLWKHLDELAGANDSEKISQTISDIQKKVEVLSSIVPKDLDSDEYPVPKLQGRTRR